MLYSPVTLTTDNDVVLPPVTLTTDNDSPLSVLGTPKSTVGISVSSTSL